MRSLALFAGCLGLDVGLEALGIEAACYVENDRDCLRVIRERRPGVPIVEDVALVDANIEATLGEIDVVAGGFPCQDLSYAGRGAGLDGDRSGLWFEMARIVGDLRPRLVLVENVPPLLIRGLHVVTHNLASLGYVGRWFTLAAADVGAPHLRERVFLVARRADVSAVDELAGGHPSGLYDPAGWFPLQESLFDPDPLRRLGKRGRWTLERIYEDDVRLAIDDDSDLMLLPTPGAYESAPTAEYVAEIREAGWQPDARLYLPDRKWHAQRTLSRVVPALLPTPGANDSTGPEGETRRARQERSTTGGHALRDLVHLLPTPTSRDGKGGNPNEREGGDDLPMAVSKLDVAVWGVYADAIERWIPLIGREPPTPLDAKGRLEPEFSEWMMGFDDGWTAVDGISRTSRLRMIGNAVHVHVAPKVGAALLALDRDLTRKETTCAPSR